MVAVVQEQHQLQFPVPVEILALPVQLPVLPVYVVTRQLLTALLLYPVLPPTIGHCLQVQQVLLPPIALPLLSVVRITVVSSVLHLQTVVAAVLSLASTYLLSQLSQVSLEPLPSPVQHAAHLLSHAQLLL